MNGIFCFHDLAVLLILLKAAVVIIRGNALSIPGNCPGNMEILMLELKFPGDRLDK